MKTTGLTLQEALQALVDGKARAAQYAGHSSVLRYDQPSGSFFKMNYVSSRVFKVDKDLLRPEWSLIDPVQEYEEVEVVRWAVCGENIISSLGRTSKASAEEFATQYPGSRIIKLTGIDRVPKKDKVTRRVEIKAMIDSAGYTETGYNNCEDFIEFPEAHGKTGKLIFEWEE